MNSERLRIVQALSEFDAPVDVDELVARSGLSRGKVLGNLPRLCIDGFVVKSGRLYALTKRGRAVIGELEPVPENNGFHFYLEEDKYTGLTAHSLKDFYEVMRKVDLKSLEFHIQRGDFENWIREVLRDEELAGEIAELRNTAISGDVLRDKLCESVGRNYRMLKTLVA